MEPNQPFLGGRGPALLWATWPQAIIGTLLITLRMRTAAKCQEESKWASLFGYRWDTVLASVAYILAMIAQVFLTISAVYGTGNHRAILSQETMVQANLWSWIGQAFAITAASFGRLGVVAFVSYVLSRTHRNIQAIVYIAGISTVVINAIETGLIFRQCTPAQRLWDHSVPGKCDLIAVVARVGFLQGSIGAVADLVLALSPIWIISNLMTMRKSEKVGLCVIIGGGLFATMAAIFKTVQIKRITETHDITYAITPLLILVMTEVWCIINFGSIAALRPLLKRTITHFTNAISGVYQKSGSDTPAAEGGSWTELAATGKRNKTHTCVTSVHKLDEDIESKESILPVNQIKMRRSFEVSRV